MEGEVITLQDLFTFDFSAGRDENGRFRGQLVSTGLRPKFAQDLHDLGVELPPTLVRQRCAMIAGHARAPSSAWRYCALSLFAGLTPSAVAAEEVPASLSDLRATEKAVTATLVIRGDKAVVVDPKSVKATVGGSRSKVERRTACEAATVHDAGHRHQRVDGGRRGWPRSGLPCEEFLAAVPDDVKVGVVSFANTSGVDVAPTTDRAKVRREVSSLRREWRDRPVRRRAGRREGAGDQG